LYVLLNLFVIQEHITVPFLGSRPKEHEVECCAKQHKIAQSAAKD
jgi:hypothetical protein